MQVRFLKMLKRHQAGTDGNKNVPDPGNCKSRGPEH